tara:strand:- start:93668 stop:94264 length:597 start_codon:yes stop_codon:yes gene_type:complete
MAIAYSQQNVELREVSLKQKPSTLIHYSPKGTVPVLILPDGTVIDESIDIMLWALSKHDPDSWQNNIAQQQQLIAQNDGSFKTSLDKYKYADRYPEQSELFYKEACYPFLDKLEERLNKHKYLFSNQYCLADIAIFPFIRQFAHVDIAWFENHAWHELTRWLNEFKGTYLFSSIMHKYPSWSEGDSPTLFPLDNSDKS